MKAAFDYAGMTLEQLKNLLSNARRLQREDVATEVLRELSRRGAARSDDFAALRWNQQAATEALAPFIEISKTVQVNKRTTYTEAGGRKIGRSKEDPDWMWVDTYTAIKTAKVNAVFVCYISRPGDEAFFELHLNGETAARYGPDDLPAALDRWQALAAEAA
ncbi:hypothetical protein [Brevundimonas viscosa]|uniref:Uncharacterized protein n=1 Tax=Brevundimonas viscosa TaxID=871741 RepID=A0A1I6T7S4_9CAUL|nr:hypothetical protein [Brevundimonas viscosa]SFS85170.1 hypothetical protein SAMN05192570_3037 [Brevundimonas viscosa]